MTNQKTVVQSKHSCVLGFLLPMITQNPLDVTDGAGGGEQNKAQVFFVLFWANVVRLRAVPREKVLGHLLHVRTVCGQESGSSRPLTAAF